MVVSGAVTFGFQLDHLLSLDVFSLDKLLVMARRARNDSVVEDALKLRYAMNADQKEFREFLDRYSNESEEVIEQRKVDEGKAALARLLGGRQ